MIDPNVALMPQIWNMDHATYLKIIDSPHWLFVNSPRMFETDFLETFSHNKWYMIFIVPFFILTRYGMQIDWTGLNIFKLLPIFLLGVFSFSLV